MKYRIKKETRGNGKVIFIPQKKVLFWWFDCYEDIYFSEFRLRVERDNLEDADNWVRIQQNNVIKKTEIL